MDPKLADLIDMFAAFFAGLLMLLMGTAVFIFGIKLIAQVVA